MIPLIRFLLLILIVCLLPQISASDETHRYTFLGEHHPDATGKVYMGRKIARVMSHRGAGWLERKERKTEEKPDVVMRLLDLKPGDTVADIGAGSGYYTRRMAAAVGAQGRVYAVDVQPEMLTILTNKLAGSGITNVTPILATERDPRLPDECLDLALMVDVYHELAFPYEVTRAVCRALKPGGRLVLLEYRGEDDWVPIKQLHKMTVAQVRKEMAAHPLRWEKAVSDQLPWQHFLVCRKLPNRAEVEEGR